MYSANRAGERTEEPAPLSFLGQCTGHQRCHDRGDCPRSTNSCQHHTAKVPSARTYPPIIALYNPRSFSVTMSDTTILEID